MLYGGKVTFKKQIATAIFAANSSEEMADLVADISKVKNNYSEMTQLTGKDRIKDTYYNGVKNPVTIFIHDNEIERDDFIRVNDINIVDRSDWEYRQERMALEDDIQQARDEHDIVALDEMSGITNHSSIAKKLGIDEDDPWDKRTDKEKEQDLLDSASHYRKLVEDGILTDEAIAPATMQAGSIENAVLNMIENIKNGGKFIDPANIPPQIQAQIDEMIKEGNLREEDVERFIDDMNEKVKEHCENDNIDEIMRIVGIDKSTEAGVVDGKVFIHTKRSDKQGQLSAPETKSKSDIEERLTAKKSEDELAEILKPAAIDGSLKSNIEEYIFDNTSMDKYDLREALDEVKSDAVASSIDFDQSALPDNLKDVEYTSSTKEYAYYAKLIDEDNGIYAFFPKGVGVKITTENIIATNNVGIYMVSDDGCVCFTLKDKSYKTVYFVTKEQRTTIFNVNV